MDLLIFQLLNQNVGKWYQLDFLGIFFAKYCEYLLIIGLLLFLLERFGKYWKMVLKAFLAAILARFVFANIIRWIVHRPRPFLVTDANLLIGKINESSFPSGHAAFYFALSTLVFYYNKEAGVLFYLVSFIICMARVFAGVHWPSDIVAGAIVGVFSGWLIQKIAEKYLKKIS